MKGATLFSTTFPCHNCAKHIVAAGIARVEYVQPFPKIQASTLHGDSLTVDSELDDIKRVSFQPFVDIAPRRYVDLFQTTNRRDASGGVRQWKWAGSLPRFPDSWPAPNHPQAEEKVLVELWRKMRDAGLRDAQRDPLDED